MAENQAESWELVELLPDLIPSDMETALEDGTQVIRTPRQVAEIMGWLQHGVNLDGSPLSSGNRGEINRMRNAWNAALGNDDGRTFEAQAALLYPQGVAQTVASEANTFGDWWRGSEGRFSNMMNITPAPIDPETGRPLVTDISALDYFKNVADLGVGAMETGVMMGSGIADLAKSGFQFGREFYRSYDRGNTRDQAIFDAQRVYNENVGELTYAPKLSRSGAGLSSVIMSPFIGLDHVATKYGQEPVQAFMGGRSRVPDDPPSPLEISRMKVLFDADQLARSEGTSLPPDMQQELNELRARFQGGIDSEGEYVELNLLPIFAGFGVRELLNLSPDLVGNSWARRNSLQRRTENQLRALGIDPTDNITRTIMERYQQAARNVSGNQMEKHQGFDMVQTALRDAQSSRKQRTRALYEAAENAGDAAVATSRLNEFNSSLYDLFDPNTSTMPINTFPLFLDALGEFNRIATGTPASRRKTGEATRLGERVNTYEFTPRRLPPAETTLTRLQGYRQSLNSKIDASNNPSEQAALMILKSKLDNEMAGWFEADLKNTPLVGDRSALVKWKEANDFRRQYAIDFDESALVSRIVENNLTRSEVKRMLFGLSESNMAPQAARVIKELRDALRDKPDVFNEMLTGLQNDVIYDVISPLLEVTDLRQVDMRGFLRNYNRVFGTRADNEFLRALFPDVEFGSRQAPVDDLLPHQRVKNPKLEALETLARHARAVRQAGGWEVSNILGGDVREGGWTQRVPRALATLLVGHEIAQAGLRVNLASGILTKISGRGGNPNFNKRIIEEMTGEPWANKPFTLPALAELPHYRIGIETHQNQTAGQPTGWESMVEQVNEANANTPALTPQQLDVFSGLRPTN